MRIIASLVAVIIITLGVTLWMANKPGVSPPEQVTEEAVAQGAATVPIEELDLSSEEKDNVRIYQSANRGVVNITTKGMQQDDMFMLSFPTSGSGSGVVLDKQGHILTNYHVVEDARQVVVNLFDGSSYRAEPIGVDPNNELAVIRVNAPAEKLFPIPWGDSSKLLVGMRVYAIGNPFGLERTLTVGIVSSLNRSLKTDTKRTIRGVIQTDAAINPGNSGGPLLNRKGEMIGITTAIVTRSGQSAGIGLAIPANSAQRIVSDLIRYGKIQRPDIGINGVYELNGGLLIAQLAPNGPAQQAGIRGPKEYVERGNGYVTRGIDRRAADLIIAVDGKKVNTFDDLLSFIESKKAGDTVTLRVIREGKRMDIPVELEAGK